MEMKPSAGSASVPDRLAKRIRRAQQSLHFILHEKGPWRFRLLRLVKGLGRLLMGAARKGPYLREEKLLSLIDPKGEGLEIGPSYNPVAPKSAGYKVKTLDHAPAEALRRKYAALGVDTSKIEEVDYIWTGQPYQDLIGQTACFDWILAGHVLEHVPDPISFLQDCSKLLKPAGVLALAVPDKRYCFDRYRPLSTTGEFLDAYLQKRSRPTPGAVFDQYANYATLEGRIIWNADEAGRLPFLSHSVDEAAQKFHAANGSQDYDDIHSWRFTLNSFRLLMLDLKALGLTDLSPRATFEPTSCEFFVGLWRGQGMESPGREELLRRVERDLRGI